MNNFDAVEMGAKLGMYFVPFLFALCFHEYAHGWVARLKGDRTAETVGRLTMNPLVHLDIIGTVVLPVLAILFGWPFFGWAKPVPINSRNLKHPKQDMFWISLAGPLSNMLLAVLGGLVIFPLVALTFGIHGVGNALIEMLKVFILINLFLAFFNLIPLHPLDGGKVIARFIPESWNMWLEQNQGMLSWLLIFVFLMGGFGFLVEPVYWVAQSLFTSGAHISALLGFRMS